MNRHAMLQTQLLGMILAPKPDQPRAVPALSLDEWRILADLAKEHRLEPALHVFAQSTGENWDIPADLREYWSQAFRTAAVRSLWNRERLIRIDGILDNAGIPYAALKGSWLAYHAYAHPALRPMRDIDILVPAGRAIEAFDALLAAGFERIPQYNTPIDFAAAAQKHLPPIRCPVTAVTVEVHTRIFVPRSESEVAPLTIDTNRLLQRRVWYPIGNVRIPFLASTDCLLHLILHAAFDHVFNNGPLLISDVALLISKAEIDWGEFWELARSGGWSRGCGLVLTLVETHYDTVRIDWPAHESVVPPSDVLAAASELMFQDFDLRAKVVLASEMASKRSILAFVALAWSRIIPPRHVLAAHGHVPVSTRWLWRHYPSWLATRSAALAKALVVPRHRRGAMHTKQVLEWQQGT